MKRIIVCIILLMSMVVTAIPQTIEHPWKGKRVAYLGDSITDPRNKASKMKYWSFLQEWLGITPYVYGISGHQWIKIPEQADRLQKEHGDDVDAIIVFVGTNDFNAGVPIGEWYTETDVMVEAAVHQPKSMQQRRHREPVMDVTTYRGRINIALSKLKQMYPTKQIVLLTPLHRAYAKFSDKNIQPAESYQNIVGEYVDKYVEVVKEAGNVWAVPVIDLNAVSGLFPVMAEHAQYFNNAETDMLHPNDKGHQRIASTLYWQLIMLPCIF